MTDRYNAVTVVLDRDIREDDATGLLAAIAQLRGVLSVTPHVVDVESLVAEERVRHRYRQRVARLLEQIDEEER